MSLKITKGNLPQSMYSIKCPHSMNPEGVSVHETGNIASAMAEISYMQGNTRLVSYHYAVDDYRVVQGLPLDRNGWHAGDGANGRGNRKTIAVEHCYNWNGRTTTENDPVNNPKYQKAIDNGVELIANLFIQYPRWGAPESGKNMWQHFDHNRKNCPQRLRQERRWNEFVGRVLARYNELKGIKTDQDRKVEVIVSGNLYRVQVGAFSNKTNAEKLAEELKAKGYPVYIPDANTVSVNAPKPKPSPQPAPAKPKVKTLHLPGTATSWNVYKANGPYTRGNEIFKLAPSKFGGLKYEIKGSPMKDVYLIDTRDRGRVAIYAAPSTGAKIN